MDRKPGQPGIVVVFLFAVLVPWGCASSSKQPEAAPVKSDAPAAPAKPASPPISAEEQFIINAIRDGDCLALNSYIEQGKDKTDPRVYQRAATGLKRYTTADTTAAKYRNNKMDPRVRRVPKNTAENVFTEPGTSIAAVVSSLTAGVLDPYGKAKAIHDWICDNIAFDAELYYTGRNRNQDYISVLKKRAALSSGYANLFAGMCKLANLEVITIRGWSKGFGYQGAIGKNTDHEWNAVKLNGKWYPVDVSLDAGYVESTTFVKHYSTAWLFPDSRAFLYSHLPEKDQHQFYAPAVNAETFQTEAYIPGIFFQYGLELKETGRPGYSNSTDGAFSFDIVSRNTNVILTSELRAENFAEINNATWQERNNTTLACFYDVPDKQKYRGIVQARYKNEKRIQERVSVSGFENVLLPRIQKLVEEKAISPAEAAYFEKAYIKIEENRMYYYREDQFDILTINAIQKIQGLLGISSSIADTVLSFSIGAGPDYAGFGGGKKYPQALPALREIAATRIISPLEGTLTAGSTVTFSLNSRDYTRIVIMQGEEIISFARANPTSPFELHYDIPEDTKEILIHGSRDGKTYTALVKYDVQP